MVALKDQYLEDIPSGSLVFPSSCARKRGNGGYLLEGNTRCVKDDSQIFPAIVINPRAGTLVTPTGLKNIGRYSLVSVMK
jgi:hypothetical protein